MGSKSFKQLMLACTIFCGSFSPELHAFESSFFDLYRCNGAACDDNYRMDVVEKGGTYFIEVEVPGLKKDNIDLSYSNDVLVIAISSETKHERGDLHCSNHEYSVSTSKTVQSGDKENKIAKTTAVTESNLKYLHRGRLVSASTRSIKLDGAKFGKAEAKLDNGILSIRIPRGKSQENFKKIKIN